MLFQSVMDCLESTRILVCNLLFSDHATYDCDFNVKNIEVVMPSKKKNRDPGFSEAISHFQAGRFSRAAAICRSIIEDHPGHLDAMHMFGLSLFEIGDSANGIEWIEKAVGRQPGNPDFRFSLGNIFQALGRLDDAEACYEKVIVLKPDHGDAHYNLGNLFLSQGKIRKAIGCLAEAVRLSPQSVSGWHNLGMAYSALGRRKAAMECFQHTIALNPRSVMTYNSMGTLRKDEGNLEEAKILYKKALDLKPDYSAAWCNLGNIHSALHETGEALKCFQKALAVKPDLPEAYYNLGNLYQQLGETEQALIAYGRALELKADYKDAVSQLYYQARQACDWTLARQMDERVDTDTQAAIREGRRPAEMPFISLIRRMDSERNTAVAMAWSRGAKQKVGESLMCRPTLSVPERDSQITIGYLSGDFRNHPVALLIAGMLPRHDRNRFRVFCYAYGAPDQGGTRKKIIAGCDRFVSLNRLSNVDAAARIAGDEVDILVDLTGHTRGNRFEICAHRPAPVQASYLGFPGSSGADFMDYFITDRVATPPDQAALYTEKCVYLPDSFMVTDNTQPIAETDFSRKGAGLPEDAFVFCSFNNPYKIDPTVFGRWMRILSQVPNSILWLFGKSELVRENLGKEAIRSGIPPGRLVFAEKMPLPDHLARLKLADLALDTWCYSGGATTVNALWAGVPVIALPGDHFASRMSSSCLSAIGLPELITNSPEAYETLAIRLAADPDALNRLKEKLELHRHSRPLFDTERFTRYLETAYEKMWSLCVAGKEPEQIKIKANTELTA